MSGLDLLDSFNGIDVICCTCDGTYVEHLNSRMMLERGISLDLIKKRKKRMGFQEAILTLGM